MNIWKKLLWIAITALGLVAIMVLALSRGEQISALWIVTAGLCAFAISYRFYSKWLATKVLVLNDERATPAVVQNDGKDFVPTNRWMVFGHHFAAIAGPGPLVGPVLAAQFGFSARHALDFDRRDSGRRRARYDCAFRFGAAARQNARPNGEGRNRPRRRRARAHQRPGDHDHFDRGAGARGRASAGQQSVGRFHDRDDDSGGVDHGIRIAQRKNQCLLDHRLRIARIGLRRLGRPISGALSGDRRVVSARPEMAGVGDHDLRPGGLDPAGLDVADAARLSQHVFETWDGRGAGRGRESCCGRCF